MVPDTEMTLSQKTIFNEVNSIDDTMKTTVVVLATEQKNPVLIRRQKLTERIEIYWEKLFCFFGPLQPYLFGTFPIFDENEVNGFCSSIFKKLRISHRWICIINSKKNDDRMKFLRMRGIFNFRNILDATTFAWTR